MSHHEIFVDGKVNVCERMCKTCIFRPGNLMHLMPGRMEDLITTATEADGCIPCHSTLYEGVQAVCRGFFDRHRTPILQIAERLECVRYVDPTNPGGNIPQQQPAEGEAPMANLTVGQLKEALEDYGDHLEVVVRADNGDHMLAYPYEVKDGTHGEDRDICVLIDLDRPTRIN